MVNVKDDYELDLVAKYIAAKQEKRKIFKKAKSAIGNPKEHVGKQQGDLIGDFVDSSEDGGRIIIEDSAVKDDHASPLSPNEVAEMKSRILKRGISSRGLHKNLVEKNATQHTSSASSADEEESSEGIVEIEGEGSDAGGNGKEENDEAMVGVVVDKKEQTSPPPSPTATTTTTTTTTTTSTPQKVEEKRERRGLLRRATNDVKENFKIAAVKVSGASKIKKRGKSSIDRPGPTSPRVSFDGDDQQASSEKQQEQEKDAKAKAEEISREGSRRSVGDESGSAKGPKTPREKELERVIEDLLVQLSDEKEKAEAAKAEAAYWKALATGASPQKTVAFS